MIANTSALIADAAKQKSASPRGCRNFSMALNFCAEQQTRWYELTEKLPQRPTITAMQKLAKNTKWCSSSLSTKSK